MIHEYSQYQLKALYQLAAYRKIFTPDFFVYPRDKEVKNTLTPELKQSIETFTEIFCQQNFANADYSIMQERQYEFDSIDNWISQMDIDIIMQCITYIIWTNKSINGYFLTRINDRFLEKLLNRLEIILFENLSMQQQIARSAV